MGEVGAISSLAPEISPLGLSPNKVDKNITKATSDWKGVRITVKPTIQIEVVLSACPYHHSGTAKRRKEAEKY